MTTRCVSASTNTKKTASPQREMILTSLEGCSALTDAANSCMETATKMRCTVPTSSARKSSADGSSLSLKRAFCAASSTEIAQSRSDFPLASTLAASLAASMKRDARSLSALESVALSAEKTIVNPSMSEISSSFVSCASRAESSSSVAMLNDTETVRSLPISESADDAVPPIPPTGAAAPEPVLIFDGLGVHTMSAMQVRETAHHGVLLLDSFFAHQNGKRLCVRRLILALPQTRRPPRRKSTTLLHRMHDVGHIESVGACFGLTLGAVIHYLDGRGLVHERAQILKHVRVELAAISDAVVGVSGDDAQAMRSGLANCHVVHPQRPFVEDGGATMDHRVGCRWACLSTTAALLIVFSYFVRVPSQTNHVSEDHSFIKSLRCAEDALGSWRSTSMPNPHKVALMAEIRALQRASTAALQAARRASETELDAHANLTLQLKWAMIAAFPPTVTVGEYSQRYILGKIADFSLFNLSPAVDVGSVPLSTIPSGTLSGWRGGYSAASSRSSSWNLASSPTSTYTAVSRASRDSLNGLSQFVDVLV